MVATTKWFRRFPKVPEFRDQRGFSLVEALVSIFLMGIVMLGVAQLIAVSIVLQKASEDVTSATVLVEQKLEELKNVDFNGLAAGGSINANQPGYFDMPDVDNDGVVDYTRRWEVLDLGIGKVMRVRVISRLAAYGPAKDSMMSALVARP
jgi:prepilin-type N-terminal cleavage/methylation domain-containing protein